MSNEKIFIVEDEPDILDVISYSLNREGFQIESSLDGAESIELIQQFKPDLILLDLMLPGMGGLDVCRHLKNDELSKHIPIIMVTAKGEESDIVLGLGLGADDYISKPFSPRELIARIKSVLRRSKESDNTKRSEIIESGELVIDTTKHKVLLKGSEIKLTATEFRLASNPGQVFPRDQLLDQAFGRNTVVVDRNIDVHIRAIRKKINADQYYIETVRGVGYRFRDST